MRIYLYPLIHSADNMRDSLGKNISQKEGNIVKKFVLMTLLFVLAFSSTALADMNDRIQIMGNVYVAGDEVVSGNAVAVMGNVLIDGAVNGDVVAVMGNTTINGKVGGDVVSVMGNTTVNGEVFGDVTAVGGIISMGGNGKISGSRSEVGLGEGVNRFTRSFHPNYMRSYEYRWPINMFRIMRFIGILGMAALVIVIFPKATSVAAEQADKEVGRKFLMGFLCLLALPIVAMMMIISLLGIPLLPLLFLLVTAGGFYGYIGISIFLGKKLGDQLHIKPNSLTEYILGALPLMLIRFVPFVGTLSSIIVMLLALGIAIETRFGTRTGDIG